VADGARRFQALVGREDHDPSAPMAFVDDVKQPVVGVRTVAEAAQS
jgi:hypothetical protein